MKIGSMFPSNYLKKEDILSPTILTIKDVTGETVAGDDGKEEKAVLHFREPNWKPMIVNKGNAITLSEAWGDETDDWKGKRVEVYIDPSVMFGGKRVGGVRVRVPNQSTDLTFDEALAAAAHVGFTREAVLERLKKAGHTAYNAAKCTPVVRAMIAEADGGAEDNIPF